jgi:hypothetical protein
MRIISDNCEAIKIDSGIIYGKQFSGTPMTFYGEPDTIEITDVEWDEIEVAWEDEHIYWKTPLSKYLKVLISLAGEGK